MNRKYPEFIDIKCKMLSKGYSQERLAKEMCISQDTLNRKLNGFRDFHFGEILEIIKILGIPHEEINKYFFNIMLQKRNKRGIQNG